MAEHEASDSPSKHVLFVDDERAFGGLWQLNLERAGYRVTVAYDGQGALAQMQDTNYDCVLCDVKMPKMNGLDVLRAIGERSSPPPVIMMSAYGDTEGALAALAAGADDFVWKPFELQEIIFRIRRVDERRALSHTLRALVDFRQDRGAGARVFEGIITQSSAMLELFRTIGKVANHKVTVLISGESGTGKELIARAIHVNSGRKGKPFVAINCGAIPPTLLESELFGHARGAFTDAREYKRGLFEEADQGTLFLDEIGELPLEVQVKLLRVLQDSEIRPLGDTRARQVDVRIIAATAKDLEEEVKQRRFRQDLYYRLNVVTLRPTPLRERTGDVPLLVGHFIERMSAQHGKRVATIALPALRLLEEYPWPGNVRELENVIERAVILAESDTIVPRDLPDAVREAQSPSNVAISSGTLSVKRMSRIIEEELIRKALRATGGNRTRAARLLEMSHRWLLMKLHEYNITPPY